MTSKIYRTAGSIKVNSVPQMLFRASQLHSQHAAGITLQPTKAGQYASCLEYTLCHCDVHSLVCLRVMRVQNACIWHTVSIADANSSTGNDSVFPQNGTVAAASYAGSTLAYVAPQMAGAIDIMVVSQPDGSLKSSPFYGAWRHCCTHILALYIAAT